MPRHADREVLVRKLASRHCPSSNSLQVQDLVVLATDAKRLLKRLGERALSPARTGRTIDSGHPYNDNLADGYQGGQRMIMHSSCSALE